MARARMERVVSRAVRVFGLGGGLPAGWPEAEEVRQLREAVSEVRAADVGLLPEDLQKRLPHGGRPGDAPAAYIPLYEDEQVSLGVFVLRGGCSIPLHDHPGMFGLLRVLCGCVHVQAYSALGSEEGGLLRVEAHPPAELGPQDPPSLLAPCRANLHRLQAVGQSPAAFLDVLAPPYCPRQGRDCRYYTPLPPQEGAANTLLLAPVPPPDHFWTEHWAYQGPPLF